MNKNLLFRLDLLLALAEEVRNNPPFKGSFSSKESFYELLDMVESVCYEFRTEIEKEEK